MKKRIISFIILCVLVPAAVVAGALLFDERRYAWVILCVTLLSCLPMFISFERSSTDAKRLVMIAVMTALSVAGRFLFAALPGFKPVTAMVVITAM